VRSQLEPERSSGKMVRAGRARDSKVAYKEWYADF
jgi:hypothetical protein